MSEWYKLSLEMQSISSSPRFPSATHSDPLSTLHDRVTVKLRLSQLLPSQLCINVAFGNETWLVEGTSVFNACKQQKCHCCCVNHSNLYNFVITLITLLRYLSGTTNVRRVMTWKLQSCFTYSVFVLLPL
jgi:hypothetical protein